MKNFIGSLVTLLILVMATMANAYVVDGLVNDWGVDLSASGASAKGYLDTNLPNAGHDTGYITEDRSSNVNPTPPVPEPGTMVLFGSGLFGLLAASVRRFFRQTKRGMDLFVAIVAIIICAIPGVIIAILIKLTSRGPVFLKQERVGQNKRDNERRAPARKANGRRAKEAYGRHFIMYKFRTMRADAEKETGPVWAAENDPRITWVGRILRKTHLDELPQLINVIKGDMSMIGPRPERPMFVKALHVEIHKYPNRLKVKPGITGLAQVRQHYDSSLRDVKRKVHYDLLYIKKMCLIMDLKIVFGTFLVMLTGKGAR